LVNNRKIRLFSGEKVNFVCPSIDVAMNSVISRPDDRIVGVILTGMGKDGVQGLAYIKHLGGGITLAQDEASSIVYGMPKAAFETGCVDFVLSSEEIRQKLINLVRKGLERD